MQGMGRDDQVTLVRIHYAGQASHLTGCTQAVPWSVQGPSLYTGARVPLRDKLHFTTFGVMTTKLSPCLSCPQEGGPRSWTQTDSPLLNYLSAGVPCTILATLGKFPFTQPSPSTLKLVPFPGTLPMSEAFRPSGLDHLSSACISCTYRSYQDYFVLLASCLFGLHVLWAYCPGPCSLG